MLNLVLLSASQDAVCAEMLRIGLETQGYRVWREPQGLQTSNIPSTIESAVLGSAVVLLLWSRSADDSAGVA